MTLGVYAMRDVYTGFMAPTVEQVDAVAIRNFGHALYMQRTLQLSAKDYDLYCLGSYDTDSGVITSVVPPRHVIDGVSAFARIKEVMADAQ